MNTATRHLLGLVSTPTDSWTHPFAPWMRQVLILAGFYNIVWGAWTVFFPLTAFSLVGLPLPNYPELCQCIGMMVGVYALAYWIAAIHPFRYWPVVLVGLFIKTFDTLGLAKALWEGRFPLTFGWNIIFDDLIWWIPFALILQQAYQHWRNTDEAETTLYHGQHAITFRHLKSQDGESILQISQASPVLLVFLRHLGCTFCRSMLHDLKEQLPLIESLNVQVGFVHMSPESSETHAFFEAYGLEECPRFSDPDRILYKSVGLKRGTLPQLFGWDSFKKGIPALLEGHGAGPLEGDGFQLSGVVLLDKGIILKVEAHANAGASTVFPNFLEGFITHDLK
jgi:peroxiredoxin